MPSGTAAAPSFRHWSAAAFGGRAAGKLAMRPIQRAAQLSGAIRRARGGGCADGPRVEGLIDSNQTLRMMMTDGGAFGGPCRGRHARVHPPRRTTTAYHSHSPSPPPPLSFAAGFLHVASMHPRAYRPSHLLAFGRSSHRLDIFRHSPLRRLRNTQRSRGTLSHRKRYHYFVTSSRYESHPNPQSLIPNHQSPTCYRITGKLRCRTIALPHSPH